MTLVIITILMPIIAGAACFTLLHRISSVPRKALITAIMVLLTIFMLNAYLHENSPPFCFSWITPTGDMCLSFERPSLLLALLSIVFLLFNFLLFQKHERSTRQIGMGLIFFSTAAMLVALFTDHFLLRYVALEITGLTIIFSTILLDMPLEEKWGHTKNVFLGLKLGDLTLLAAILLMFAHSGTMDISANFSAALTLPAMELNLVAGLLLIAIWVKLGLFPLSLWTSSVSRLPKHIRTWFADFCMPLLGAYLLYRSVPLVGVMHSAAKMVFMFFLVVATAVTQILQKKKNGASTIKDASLQFLSINLVLSAFYLDQKQFWFCLVLWFISRGLLVLIGNKYEIVIAGRQININHIYFMVGGSTLLQLFFFYWYLSQTGMQSWQLILIGSIGWWQSFYGIGQLRQRWRAMAADKAAKEHKPWKVFSTVAVGSIVVLGSVWLLTTLLVLHARGDVYLLFSTVPSMRTFPIFTPQFWIACLVGGLCSWLVMWTQRHHVFQTGILLLNKVGKIFRMDEKVARGDPIDISTQAAKVFIKLAKFLYRSIEKDGLTTILKGLKKVFVFLFDSVEKYISRDMWTNVIRGVLGSSRRLQKAHTGIMRLNLLWLLVVIGAMVVLVIRMNGAGV